MDTILEAIKDLNEVDSLKLVVIYYKNLIEQYLDADEKVKESKVKNIKLSRSGHGKDISDIGRINKYTEVKENVLKLLPFVFDIDKLIEIYKAMSSEELNHKLTDEERAKVKDYEENIKLKNKLPREGQKFKFSYIPVTYEVVDVDLNNGKIYYKADSRTYPDDISIDSFIEKKGKGTIYYL